jgi:hypothetical protein
MTRTQTSTGWLPVARWLALAGMIGAVVWGFFSYQLLQDRLDALSRTTVPGQVTVEALEPEGLMIYFTLLLGSLVVVLAALVVGAFTRSRGRSFEDAGRTPTHRTA